MIVVICDSVVLDVSLLVVVALCTSLVRFSDCVVVKASVVVGIMAEISSVVLAVSVVLGASVLAVVVLCISLVVLSGCVVVDT